MEPAGVRAIKHSRAGGREHLECIDLPDPVPQAGEVRIRVTHSGVDLADLVGFDSRVTLGPRLAVPGCEVVGIREDTSSRVVALLPGYGGYADLAVARPHFIYPVPSNVSDDDALGLFKHGLTAWLLLRRAGRLRGGESVAIHAAAGGVGQMAIQISRILGAGRIIALASTEDRRRYALELGADITVDSNAYDLGARLRSANHDAGLDLILEKAGGAAFTESALSLAPFGRLVAYGQTAAPYEAPNAEAWAESNVGIHRFRLWPILVRDRPLIEHAWRVLLCWYQNKQLIVRKGLKCSPKEFSQSLQLLRSNEMMGKIILSWSD